MRFRVLFLVLLFILTSVCGFSQAQDEWFMDRPIRDIVFSGIKNVSLSELEGMMQPYRGRLFDESVYLEILTRLFALDYFSNIEATTQRADAQGNEVIIRFTVTEHPIIRRINFTGNSGVRRTALLDAITTKANDFQNSARLRADVEAIRSLYVERGFPNATVTVSEVPSGESAITVVFNINEGDKITIRNIEFIGNTRFSARTLRSQMSLKQKTLFNDGAFQEAGLIADIDAIEMHYRDRGYINAVVRDVTRTYDLEDGGTNMTLTFYIDEGEIFTFGGVTFEGNVIFSDAQLGRLINSKTGDTVNYSRVLLDLQRVSDLYFENGYIFNTIERIQNKDSQNNVLSFHVFIVERGRAYIENIIVLGNDKTRTDVILREIPLEPGDVFSRTKVLDAMRNLYNTRFFSMIMPDTIPGSSENLMELVFTVEEQPTTDVQIGATFSGSADPDTFPISGMLKWNDINIAGTGNQLGAELTSSIVDTTTFSVNYLHRWILGLPLSGGVDFSVNHARRMAQMNNTPPIFYGDEWYAYPDGFESYEEFVWNNRVPPRDYLMNFNQWYLSLGFNTGYRWGTFLGVLGVGGGIRFGIIRNDYDEKMVRPFDPVLRDGNNKWTPKNSFSTSVTLDSRDMFFDPTRGYLLSERLGFFGIFPKETEHYMQNDLKAQYFLTLINIPVTEKWAFRAILAVQGGLSLIFQQPGRDLVIENASRLSVDGMFNGRGWSNQFSNKGHMLLDNWVELRFPVIPGILAWDFFFDIAAVDTRPGDYFNNFTHKNLLFSYGGGFRFTLPQFPFRISLAHCFDYAGENGTGFRWNRSNNLFGVTGLAFVISFVVSN